VTLDGTAADAEARSHWSQLLRRNPRGDAVHDYYDSSFSNKNLSHRTLQCLDICTELYVEERFLISKCKNNQIHETLYNISVWYK
jgi:hypothetical protein